MALTQPGGAKPVIRRGRA